MPVEGANRRAFIAGVCGAAAWPVAAAAQSVMPVVGFVGLSSPEGFPDQVAAFRSGLSEAGHVEGRERRNRVSLGLCCFDRAPAVVAELIDR